MVTHPRTRMFEKRRASTGASFFVPEILTMVEHVVSSFLGHLEKEKRASKHTLRNYEVDLNQCQQFLADTYESSLVEMQGDWLRSWVVSMVQEGKRPKTIHRKISACRTFVKYALRQGWMDSDPTEAVVLPKLDKRIPEVVPEHAMATLFEEAWSRYAGLERGPGQGDLGVCCTRRACACPS